jgi:hypothetical protein
MKSYGAGRHGAEGWQAGTREWVFGLLPTRHYRERCDLLSRLELRRRPDCEPTLRALVTDEWTPETHHHLGWCDSCRTAGFALSVGTPGTARRAPRRRRTLWLALAAGAAIAAPLGGAQLVDDPFGQKQEVRGGLARSVPVRQARHVVPVPQVVPVPRSKPVGVTPAVRHVRSVTSERGQRALPLTT